MSDSARSSSSLANPAPAQSPADAVSTQETVATPSPASGVDGTAQSVGASLHTSSGAITQSAPENPDSIMSHLDFSRLFELIGFGGPVTVVLLLMSIVTTTVILVKLWQFTRLRVNRRALTDRAVAAWIEGKSRHAIGMLAGRHNPSAKVVRHAMDGLEARIDEARVREDVERLASSELASLRSCLRIIEATVQTAPLLGLFGTVLGMISSFRALQNAGAEADPSVLAGGIWVALLTTAVGLAIAIPASAVQHWFDGKIERERQIMEDAVTQVFTRGLSKASEPQDTPMVDVVVMQPRHNESLRS